MAVVDQSPSAVGLQFFSGIKKQDLVPFVCAGVKPGERIEFLWLPDGRAMLKAARSPGTIAGFVSLLAGRSLKVASIEEIGAAAAQGWANRS